MARKKGNAPKTVLKQTRPGDDMAPYYFHQGTSERAYDYLGVHRTGGSWVFRVWAPHAEKVCLTGDFNYWSDSNPMQRETEAGVWSIVLPDEVIHEGMFYKYRIFNHGQVMLKADPYAVRSECPPKTASIVWDMKEHPYSWNDGGWMERRRRTMPAGGEYHQPLNIYELHAESWKRHGDGSILCWRELADELAPYVKSMGYTHVELLPIMEYPYSGSWGYQVTGYYSPSARFGTPEDFMYFVDTLHCAGIGVILDWVPAHFPKDAHGLYEFDGQPLYEYQAPDRMEMKGWGTRMFDLGRPEVESFLVSSAVYWVDTYHADGLRVDAVASMLYLDFEKQPGEWTPNAYGDNRCLEAIAFLKKMNGAIAGLFPDVMTIAEESSSWPHVTGFDNDGLGFTYKWDMGWMNDTLAYIKEDPLYRSYHHDKLTFGMMYAFNEHYVMPISHDEVVHLKKSFLDKMPGNYEEKFAGDRVFHTYMMTRPAKKLTFMGSEIGQFHEWDEKDQVNWFLLDFEMHRKLQRYWSDINNFYLEHPALWEQDDSWSGFRWVDADNSRESVLTYLRTDNNGKCLLVCLNFTPVTRDSFRVGVPQDGRWRELINSDDSAYGGWGQTNPGPVCSEPIPQKDFGNSISIKLPALGATIWERVEENN